MNECYSFENIATEKNKREWMEDRNGSMRQYAPRCATKVWMKCEINPICHIWQVSLNHLSGEKGCPYCCAKIKCPCGCNTLLGKASQCIKDEWNQEKNGDMKNYVASSKLKVEWICIKNRKCHRWVAPILKRMQGRGCPYCANKKMCQCGNCDNLETLFPELKKEWDNEKNKPMNTYGAGSRIKVSWICSLNSEHKWITAIYERTTRRMTGCPFCCSSKLEKNFTNYLKSNNIIYETQKQFKDCKNERRLRYDFFFQYNHLNIRVELNGKQHFSYVEYFYKSIDKFKRQLLVDVNKSMTMNDSYLNISYLGLNHLDEITTNFIKKLTPDIFRIHIFYITNILYMSLIIYKSDSTKIKIESSFTNDENKKYLLNDDILQVVEGYRCNIESIINNRIKLPKIKFCEVCNRHVFCLKQHNKTTQHISKLK